MKTAKVMNEILKKVRANSFKESLINQMGLQMRILEAAKKDTKKQMNAILRIRQLATQLVPMINEDQ